MNLDTTLYSNGQLEAITESHNTYIGSGEKVPGNNIKSALNELSTKEKIQTQRNYIFQIRWINKIKNICDKNKILLSKKTVCTISRGFFIFFIKYIHKQ